MIKILGIADIAAAALLASKYFNFNISSTIIIAFSVYLFIKALIFLKDIGSILDVFAGILLISSLSMAPPGPILWFIVLLLGLKGIQSLVS